MDFGTVKDAAMLVLMFLVFGVPAVAIAVRIALKPVLEAVVRLRDRPAAANPIQSDPRLAALEAEVSRLQIEVQRLAEVESFTRQLTEGAKLNP